MEFIKSFAELGKGDAATAGGKGASLGETTQAGIPVPPGFVVLAGAFEQFLRETDLLQEIDAIVRTVNTAEMHTVEHASEKIQALILGAQMPVDIAQEIENNFKDLDAEFVAVRSSATAEDSASAAWAGQLDSFLNTTEAELLHNVQRCWASLFTPRAIFYRFEKELHLTKISVAVVVQKMVASEVSGIAFSVHPVTEDRNQLIIEAGWGLGEAIVSGQVTPDSYVVTKEPRQVIDINAATQTRGLYKAAGGGNEWQDIKEPKASAQVLSEAQILELSELIVKIEDHYGFPCDIEWAFERGKFYIVQSRPITTLAPTTEDVPLSFLKQQDLKYVGLYKCSPFSLWYWAAWHDTELANELGVPHEPDIYFGLKGGHAFSRLSSETHFAAVVKEKVENGDVEYFRALCAGLERETEKAKSFGLTLAGQDLTAEQFSGLVERGRRLLFFCFVAWQNSQQFDGFFKSAAKAAGIPEDQAGQYIPAPHTLISKQHDEALALKILLEASGIWELLKEDPQKALQEIQADKTLWPQFEAHLKKYEWLNLMNWTGDAFSLEKLLEQMSLMRPLEHVDMAEVPKEFKKYIDIAAEIAYLRNAGVEHLSIYTKEVMEPLQRLAKRMGISYRDFLLLVPTEIYQDGVIAPGYKEKIERRQQDNWCIYHDPVTGGLAIEDNPAVVESVASRLLPKREENTDGVIKGQVGNKGKAVGLARVILSTDDFYKMQPGDILVAPMTTPDYVLLMQKSAAIVTDMGGLLCHAAIVSRELNKPCVIDAKFATQALKDGDLVEVDADNGVVRILESTSDSVITFKKSYSRDTTLFMQGLWARGLTQLAREKFGWDNPHLPFVAHFVSDGVVEIWEHKPAIAWFLDRLLKENTNNPDFLKNLLVEYKGLLAKLKKLHDKGYISSAEDLELYKDLVYHAAFFMTIFFYTGVDERNSQASKDIGVEAREAGDFFADNDVFVRKNIAKLGGFSEELAGVVLQEEFETLPPQETLAKRLEAFLLIDGGKAHLGTLQAFSSNNPGYVFEGLSASGADEVRGQVAYAGIVRGVVRIVKKQSHMANVKEGDILVSPMTTPDFLPAMKLAGAFVTDEGGVTCHAAIVAREMKKPCIIGTKIATQLLKDGDMVEVDAEKGVVTIRKRA